MKFLPSRIACVGVVLGALLLTGCGPISSFSSITQAKSALQAAYEVQGWKYGCYEYYAAMRFLYRARIEAGYSDFEASTDYANKAYKYARRARALAQLHRSGRSPILTTKTMVRFVREAKGQVRVVCNKPPAMVKKYAPPKKKKK